MNIMFFLTAKRNVTFLYEDEDVMTGLRKLKQSGYHTVPVISRAGIYRGVVTEGDFLWLMVGHNEIVGGKKTASMTVGDIPKSDDNPAVSCACSIFDVLEQATRHNFVPVIDGRGVFIGMITRKSVIEYCLIGLRQQESKVVGG